MGKRKNSSFSELWSIKPDPARQRDLSSILSVVENLPLRYWQPGYFFWGLLDETIHSLSNEKFPANVVPMKRRPVFCLRMLPDTIGAEVCPCSTKKQYKKTRYIRKGCVLDHTGYIMDKQSYLVERIRFNIPSLSAGKLKFRGKVPTECICDDGESNDE